MKNTLTLESKGHSLHELEAAFMGGHRQSTQSGDDADSPNFGKNSLALATIKVALSHTSRTAFSSLQLVGYTELKVRLSAAKLAVPRCYRMSRLAQLMGETYPPISGYVPLRTSVKLCADVGEIVRMMRARPDSFRSR